MEALAWWLAFVAVVGWGLFGVLVWLTWNRSWRDLRSPRPPAPLAAVSPPPEGASLPAKITHILRSSGRPLRAPEIFELLRAGGAPPLDHAAMHSTLYRMKMSKPPRLVVTGARPNCTYALPSAGTPPEESKG